MDTTQTKSEKILQQIDPRLNIVDRFVGGMSNQTYLVSDDKHLYTFRLPYDEGKVFCNFHTEHRTLNLIAPLEINAKTYFFDESTGIKISEYVAGHNLTTINYIEVSRVLKTLHTSNIQLPPYDHVKRLTTYEQLLPSLDYNYINLKNLWLELYDQFLCNYITTPCHGDSQISNFIEGKKLYLLDWEFSGQNDSMYDLACFGNDDFNDAILLLKTYQPNYTNNELLRLYGWRMFQCLQWYLVASYKANCPNFNKSGINFNTVSQSYLNKAQVFYDTLKQIASK